MKGKRWIGRFGIVLGMMILLVGAGCDININIDGNADPIDEANGEATQKNGSTDHNSDEQGNDDSASSDSGSNDSDQASDGSNGDNENESNAVDGVDGSLSVKTYFPFEVGYEHHVSGSVPDGFGEIIQIVGEQNDYYLATGGSTAMGFVRLYEITDQQAKIIYETNEETSEYYSLTDLIDADDINAAITYCIDHTNANVVLLQTPIEEGASWDDGHIVNLNVPAILYDNSNVPALLVEYTDSNQLHYYQEDVGLVAILYNDPAVIDMFGDPVHAQKMN